MCVDELSTTGEIASACGVTVADVNYAILKLRVDHARRFGCARVYDAAAVAMLVAHFNAKREALQQ